MCRSSLPADESTTPKEQSTDAARGARLTIKQGVGAGESFSIIAPVTTLGRHSGCDIVLDHPTISRHHAAMHCHDDSFTIADAGSANGTYLNDRRIMLAEITHGDEIAVGPFRFVFQIAQ